MKKVVKLKSPINATRQFFATAGMLILSLLFVNGLLAQTETAPAATADTTAKPVAPAAEAPELISPSLKFTGVQKGDNTIDFRATLKAKVKGGFIKLPFLKVKFIAVNGTDETELGFAITNGEGKALFNFKPDTLKPDTEGKFHFKAVFAGNKALEAAEEEVSFKRARLEIIPVKEDSILTVKLRLIDVGTGTEVPVKEVTLGVYIKRSFNPLKLGEAATDESGEMSVEIPNNLPGDAKGNITLSGRLDENEIYGNLEASVVQQWGTPVSDKITELPRELWSPHPPLWMLVTFIILMGTVWGHYVVIVVQLFRLRKEEPHGTVTA
ncbi:MAG: hypothetical protein WCI49_09020 [Ferruginibacter sp.]